jgi:hypothetical protein
LLNREKNLAFAGYGREGVRSGRGPLVLSLRSNPLCSREGKDCRSGDELGECGSSVGGEGEWCTEVKAGVR